MPQEEWKARQHLAGQIAQAATAAEAAALLIDEQALSTYQAWQVLQRYTAMLSNALFPALQIPLGLTKNFAGNLLPGNGIRLAKDSTGLDFKHFQEDGLNLGRVYFLPADVNQSAGSADDTNAPFTILFDEVARPIPTVVL